MLTDADALLGVFSLQPPLAFVPSLKLPKTSRSHLTPSPTLPLNPPAGQTPPSLTHGDEGREGGGEGEKVGKRPKGTPYPSPVVAFVYVRRLSLTHSFIPRAHSSSQLTAGSLRLPRQRARRSDSQGIRRVFCP